MTLAGAWRWLNADGFTQSPPVGSKRHWLFFWVRIQLYDFRMTAGLPLTLLDPDGNRYRTDQTVRRSDEGSVPLFTSYLGIAKDTFVRAFTFHDFGFKKHGLWFCGAGSTVWAWLPMTRTALNEILAHGAEAEDGTAFHQSGRAVGLVVLLVPESGATGGHGAMKIRQASKVRLTKSAISLCAVLLLCGCATTSGSKPPTASSQNEPSRADGCCTLLALPFFVAWLCGMQAEHDKGQP
ncbi:MAG: hypothetical protein NTY53_17030 [Kiritimatiellaeota bacterium]|nr:hypothetical protein [Kiritimatiellota bacterium]